MNNKHLKEEIKKKENGFFYVECLIDENETWENKSNALDNKLKELIGITRITYTFNECYNNLVIGTIYNEQTKTTTLPSKMANVKYVIRTGSLEIQENNGKLEKIKFVGVEELEMNNNINNPNIKSALIYMGDLNENNTPIKISNAMEAIIKYYIRENEDISEKEDVYKKLSELGLCSVKKCKKLFRTANGINNFRGRHYKFGHEESPMEDKEMIAIINKILRHICTS